jgi:hypothetical protein
MSAQLGLAPASHGSDRHASALSGDLAEMRALVVADVSACRRLHPGERVPSGTTVDLLKCGRP